MAELNENDRAELVAYLDGELGDEASQRLEARLSRDRQLRAEAEALKRTWEMLDFLPRAEPSASFTHKTLERLAIHSTASPAARAKARLRKWAMLGGWAAGLVIAVLTGLLASHLLWPSTTTVPNPTVNQQADTEAQIARDLEVIRNKRIYENADNIEFARALQEAFGDEEDEL
jgi:anti-sigma factor RsiW